MPPSNIPGNNPVFVPLAPTPDHHPSSNFSISSINSPSTRGISFSSDACEELSQSSDRLGSDEGSIPHTRIGRSRIFPCFSSVRAPEQEPVGVEAAGEARQILVLLVQALVR